MAVKRIVVLLVGLTVISSVFAEAPQHISLLGGLIAGSPSSMATRINAFQQRLREMGYTEGRNIVVEYHYASGNYDRSLHWRPTLFASKRMSS
jgi:putative ABC transport system substrate-binding protein